MTIEFYTDKDRFISQVPKPSNLETWDGSLHELKVGDSLLLHDTISGFLRIYEVRAVLKSHKKGCDDITRVLVNKITNWVWSEY